MEGQFVVVMLLFGAVAVMGNSPLDDEGIYRLQACHKLVFFQSDD